jgi:hypothetical protein
MRESTNPTTTSSSAASPWLRASATWGLTPLPFADNAYCASEWRWLMFAAPLLPSHSRYLGVS